jgi:hypothetical protein
MDAWQDGCNLDSTFDRKCVVWKLWVRHTSFWGIWRIAGTFKVGGFSMHHGIQVGEVILVIRSVVAEHVLHRRPGPGLIQNS